MSVNRVACPECGAGLKSQAGFKPGQRVYCPKCETYFEVEEPADDAGDEAEKPKSAGKPAGKKPVRAAAADEDEDDFEPKRKKKRRDDDDERSYKTSPVRYAVLAVLVLVMCVLGYLLYQKKQREGADTAGGGSPDDETRVITPRIQGPLPPGPPLQPKLPNMGGVPVNPGGFPAGVPGKFPKLPPGGTPVNPPAGGGGFFPGGSTLSPAEADALLAKFKKQLVGTWKADLGGGKTAELVYGADGSYTETFTDGGNPKTVSGTWTAGPLAAGNKGIQINRSTGGAKKVVFEDDEMIHDTPERGLVGVFRRQ